MNNSETKILYQSREGGRGDLCFEENYGSASFFFFFPSARCELFRLSLRRVLAALQTETSIIPRNRLQHLGPARLHVFDFFPPIFLFFPS